jgi:hypothetical protein
MNIYYYRILEEHFDYIGIIKLNYSLFCGKIYFSNRFHIFHVGDISCISKKVFYSYYELSVKEISELNKKYERMMGNENI